MPHRAREDPQRRRRRPSRHRQDVPGRGDALPGGRDQPPRHGRATAPPSSDWDEDEQKRQMSISRRPCCTSSWQGRKINLIDAPGDPASRATRSRALRVVEGALVVVNGVDGRRGGDRAPLAPRRRARLARVVFVNMLDRERADFVTALAVAPGAALAALRRDPAPDRHRARADAASSTCCTCAPTTTPARARARASPARSRTTWSTRRAEYREKLLDAVVETRRGAHGAYLEGEEIIGATSCAPRSRPRSRAASCSRSRAARRRRTWARTRCST